MADISNNLTAALGQATRLADMRRRLLFLLGGLIVFRVGSYIPVPGIDSVAAANFFSSNSGTILGLANMFTGGALARLSIFAMGVMPYISASIIVQMMSMVIPQLQALRKEGESGRRKITQYTRYLTVPLAMFQAYGAALAIQSGKFVYAPGFQFLFVATVTMTAGTVFLMWLGEQITERGMGNGISMIILTGIVANIPLAIGNTLDRVSSGEMGAPFFILLIAVIVMVTGFCVFMERAQRRIAVNYAKRQVGRRVFAGQVSHLPFKLNMSGVIPPIFASSILVFPATIAQFFAQSPDPTWWQKGLQDVSQALNSGQPLHIILYAALIIFFCFFYTALMINSRETAENLQKSGAFIPGIRPGQQTASYIDKVLTRLTMWGGFYVMAVCILPEILRASSNVPFAFGGTSLLIVVVVIMDFIAQMSAHLMSHQYESLLKKANLSGRKS
ncbi:MAG TPA: preprotein translocase subunit SecY [Steroidobacteraceae bacterium]|nr:preprotein translocase subunit SecY [Steroidobacteraceae bacterium]